MTGMGEGSLSKATRKGPDVRERESLAEARGHNNHVGWIWHSAREDLVSWTLTRTILLDFSITYGLARSRSYRIAQNGHYSRILVELMSRSALNPAPSITARVIWFLPFDPVNYTSWRWSEIWRPSKGLLFHSSNPRCTPHIVYALRYFWTQKCY